MTKSKKVLLILNYHQCKFMRFDELVNVLFSNRAKLFLIACVLFTGFLLSGGAQAQDDVTYTELAPIFSARCVMCHAGEFAPLGLQLDSYESILKGSVNGPVIKADDVEGSELIRRLKGESLPRMPLTGPPFLSDEEIGLFTRWIESGMPEGQATQAKTPAKPEASRPPEGHPITYANVSPILNSRCVKCHTQQGLMGNPPEGYLLDSYQSIMATSDRVRVVPGNPSASELVRRIKGHALPRMPFDGPPYLSTVEISLIEDWIAQGARNSDGSVAAHPIGSEVRLHGTLQAGWILNGLELVMNGNTRIDKSPRPGDYVQVRGRIDANGQVRVERIRPR